MKRVVSMMLLFSLLIVSGTVVTNGLDTDGLVKQSLEYTEVDGRVNQVDGGFTISTKRIYSNRRSEGESPMNDSGYQYYFLGLERWSASAGGADGPLPEWYLEWLDASFANLRANGGACIVRPCYSLDGHQKYEPKDFNVLLNHQSQLASVFAKYTDVITTVECGMIGAFGAMWGGLYSKDTYKAQVLGKWLECLPEEISVNVRTLSEYLYYVNTSDLWKNVYRNNTVDGVKYPTSITENNYYNYLFEGTEFERICFYNEAMIQDGNDGGSFAGGRDNFIDWLSKRRENTDYGGAFSPVLGAYRYMMTYWLPMKAIPEFYEAGLNYYYGGDNVYKATGKYYSEYSHTATYDSYQQAAEAVEDFYDNFGKYGAGMPHSAQINGTKVTYTMGGWSGATVTEKLIAAIGERIDLSADLSDSLGDDVGTFFERHIGYRPVLRESYLSQTVERGGILRVKGTVDNTGFDSVGDNKITEIVITDGQNAYTVPTDIDASKWAGGSENHYDVELSLPASIPAGEYSVYMRIAPQDADGNTVAANGVRFANPGPYMYTVPASVYSVGSETLELIYDSALGANYLGSFTVSTKIASESDEDIGQILTLDFYDEARTKVLGSERVLLGGSVTPPLPPVKDGGNEYESFTFIGWETADGQALDPECVAVSGALYPVYEGILRKYNVAFYDGQTEVARISVEHGASVNAPTVTRENTECVTYTFAGWLDEGGHTVFIPEKITQDMSLYANFEKTVSHIRPQEWSVQAYPTVGDAGLRKKACTRCGEVLSVDMISALQTLHFSDVENGSWYYNAVSYAVGKGLFKGMSETEFAPNNAMNRAMLVSVLYRLEGSPWFALESNPFEDVEPSRYYYNAVMWANSKGIVMGKSTDSFAPDDPITREQLAAILYRYEIGKYRDVTVEGDLGSYPDADEVGSYAKDAMLWANTKGLITGVKSGDGVLLDPKGGATRAQVATVLMRYLLMY